MIKLFLEKLYPILFGHQSHFEKYIIKGFSPQKSHLKMFKLSKLNLLQGLTSKKNRIKIIFDLNIIQKGIDTLKIFLKILFRL